MKIVPNVLFLVVLFSLGISMSGAWYVNHQKKYTITQQQLDAALWIKEHLPEDRIIHSMGHKNLLQFHADSSIVKHSEEAICHFAFEYGQDKTVSSFVFFSQSHPKNPYSDREYKQTSWGARTCTSREFKKNIPLGSKLIYNDNDETLIVLLKYSK